MPELTPDELRAAFADVDEPILPPGSMMLETAREVANRFASAWEADRKRQDAVGNALVEGGFTPLGDDYAASVTAMSKRLEEVERERDEARQEAAFLRCHWAPPGDPIDDAENEERRFPWEGDAALPSPGTGGSEP